MIIIDEEKFLTYLIFSKHIDGLTCGEIKEAIEMCKVEEVIEVMTKKGVMTKSEAQRYYEGVLDGFRESEKCFREENKALEQEPLTDVLDKIEAEVINAQLVGYATINGKREIAIKTILEIINKYRKESEDKDQKKDLQ